MELRLLGLGGAHGGAALAALVRGAAAQAALRGQAAAVQAGLEVQAVQGPAEQAALARLITGTRIAACLRVREWVFQAGACEFACSPTRTHPPTPTYVVQRDSRVSLCSCFLHFHHTFRSTHMSQHRLKFVPRSPDLGAQRACLVQSPESGVRGPEWQT